MTGYLTQQKRSLLRFLTQNSERAFTVEEITEGMKNKEDNGASDDSSRAPGKSTVYRLITRFVEEGTVKRFERGHSRRFAYQIVSGERCHFHLHMKCSSCGKLFHLDEGVSDELLHKIKRLCNFSISETDTVLFGLCGKCAVAAE